MSFYREVFPIIYFILSVHYRRLYRVYSKSLVGRKSPVPKMTLEDYRWQDISDLSVNHRTPVLHLPEMPGGR